MSFAFQSICSSSAANCLIVSTPTTRIAIDCGFQTQRGCRASLGARLGELDAVIVSHAHGDHIGYHPTCVLSESGVAIRAHQRVVGQISRYQWARDFAFRPFADEPFQIGDLQIAPIELPHQPAFPTFGFVITYADLAGSRRIVVCTDFYDHSVVLPHCIDADFLFVEANHDLALLRRYPNPNSRWHLSNAKTARLLCDVVRASTRPPRAVMLGHLSEKRNREDLALNEVRALFERENLAMPFQLSAAPAREPSKPVHVH